MQGSFCFCKVAPDIMDTRQGDILERATPALRVAELFTWPAGLG